MKELRGLVEIITRKRPELHEGNRKRPVKTLPAFERAAVIPLLRDIAIKANYLLGYESEVERFVTDCETVKILGKEALIAGKNFSNADLAIQFARYNGRIETYIFYSQSVDNFITRKRVHDASLADHEAEGEANLKDLTKLFRDISNSKPVIQETESRRKKLDIG